MLIFDFYSPARILFGKDEEKHIGELLKANGEAVEEIDPIGGLKKLSWQDVPAIYESVL